MAVSTANGNRNSQFPSAGNPLGGYIWAAEVNDQRDSAKAYLACHLRRDGAYRGPDKITDQRPRNLGNRQFPPMRETQTPRAEMRFG